ncbi:hypothetical protein ACLOJK_007795 [Asimina triloba]
MVYPRLKARGEEDEGVSVAVQGDKSDFLLRVFDSLSLEDRRSPGISVVLRLSLSCSRCAAKK